MMTKNQSAYALVYSVLTHKKSHVGVKVYINTSRPASNSDIRTLCERIRNGKDGLADAYKDNRGCWHFVTTA